MNKLKPHLLLPPKLAPQPLPAVATRIPSNYTKYFNGMINRQALEGAYPDVLETYCYMLRTGTPPDSYTFPSLLKACSNMGLISHGILFHQHAIVSGCSSDAYIAVSVINFYGKFGYTQTAYKVFETMPERNIVPWTAIIGCFSHAGDIFRAFSMFNLMRLEGVRPCSVTLLAMLSGVSQGTYAECLHALVILSGFHFNTAVMNSMLNAYGKCGRVEDARDLFESMDEKDIVSWNTLVFGYAMAGNTGEILRLLYRMRVERTEPDQQTYGSLVTAMSRESGIGIAEIVHGKILTSGFEFSEHIGTSLIIMYLNCRNVDDAFRIFERTFDKDVIMWTAMISGLVQNDCAGKALTVFRWMLFSGVKPTATTIASALAACAKLDAFTLGSSIHSFILRHQIPLDLPPQNSLVTMYAKCGHLDQSHTVFNLMSERDVVSWNSIVAAYAQDGYLCEALSLFHEMRESLQRPDSVTVVSLLQACASIGAFRQGKWIHSFVIRSCIGPCILINTALVDMYSKSGNLGMARKCFDRMAQHDLVSWSTMISGYGSHGKGKVALEMFSEFLGTGLEPNGVIFLSILGACSHNGLIKEGLRLFYSMKRDFGIEPDIEHSACIVDLLCRAGRVKDAYDFYKKMFSVPMADILGILLDACRATRNMKLGEIIAKDMFVLKPSDAGKYVQLAHCSAAMARWDSVGAAWMEMKSCGIRKLPGWSFIELNGIPTTFFANQSSHMQYEDIVLVLRSLTNEIRDLHKYYKVMVDFEETACG